jgi:ATP-dependent DNA helicase PIF1
LRTLAEFILAVGEKRFKECAVDKIQLPKKFQLPNNKIKELIASVYGNLQEVVPTAQYLAEQAILVPRNLEVANINDMVLDLPREATTYFSADTVAEGAAELYSSDHSLYLECHIIACHLSLKIGATVILLRNLSPLHGFCNGTRLQITHLGRNFIGGIILTGTCKGQKAHLPQIEITSNADSDLGFQLNWRQ